MKKETTSSAPWGLMLKGMTAFCAVILLGIPATVLIQTGRVPPPALLPPAVLVVAAFFMIRGYELRPGELIIKRLGWNNRLDLTGLQSAEADPSAMSGSIRTFGNGGLFCFAGWFRSKKLGSYRAFATDPKRSVILQFPKRTVVITPDDPQAFVNALEK